ncbi:MAG: zf-HC2 domain-containing protein [Candidatus Omnitrophica bacterium]|nr:zf-HC2 domain-containing protein [Candidatus Omnitrophota bacterium]
MEENIEFIKKAFQKWKKNEAACDSNHLDEMLMACFIEGKLSNEELESLKMHIIGCDDCANKVLLQAKLVNPEDLQIPEELLLKVKDLASGTGTAKAVLEIFLKLKENFLELINTSGDILVGQELMPSPLLRSRNIKDFKDEVVILKDFDNFRVEVKIENKDSKYFNLLITAKNKDTQELIKDLRITLIRDNLELESYLSDSGKVIFDHVLLGKYVIEICSSEDKLVSIHLDVKI